jgi:hypothetical protein
VQEHLAVMLKSSCSHTTSITRLRRQVLIISGAARKVACYARVSSRLCLSLYLLGNDMVFAIQHGQFRLQSLRILYLRFNNLSNPWFTESRCTFLNQPARTFLNQVSQSTIALDFPNSSSEEISQRTSMMNSVEENRQMLQRQRSIL